MSNAINTPQDFLDSVGAKDFRSLTKKQIMSFVESVNTMDPDVAIEIVKQIPEFYNTTKNVIDKIVDFTKDILHDGSDAHKQTEFARLTAIEELRTILNQSDELTFDQKMIIIDRINDIADKMKQDELDHKEFLKNNRDNVIKVAAIGLIGAGAIFLGPDYGEKAIDLAKQIGTKVFQKKN